jgi:hypothetical protein
MIRRTYMLNGLNREALNAALIQLLGIHYGGFADRQTVTGYTVTVFLSSALADFAQLDALMAAHDPQQLTAEQRARQEQQQKLASARRDYQGSDLDPADYAGENALVQTLARKIAWLEQEVASLREG